MGELKADSLDLDSVQVTTNRANLLGLAQSASQGLVPADRIRQVPLLRPAEVLEQTPGLIVSQHAGDGKANQYYLRGFNLDHGTDFALHIDGMPINMPTHGHGQGYADANFLIPELIEHIAYKKGPYDAEEGDFSAAGAVHMHYFRHMTQGIAQLTTGKYGYNRLLLADSLDATTGYWTYGLETSTYDGPWQNAQNLGRVNGILRWSEGTDAEGVDITAMFYRAHWVSTDQVPRRALNSGAISRWGSVDNTDGGHTHRYSFSTDWRDGPWHANAYVIDYKLNLFSNFTYFLDDPVNGDQFQQYDDRMVYGGALSHQWQHTLLGHSFIHAAGLQTRYDNISQVGLYHTLAKKRINTVREDSVRQWNASAWWQGEVAITDFVRGSLGLRADRYRFKVESDNDLNSGHANSHLLNPKFGLAWQVHPQTEIYYNWGRGFHSNDGRGATITVDPKTGDKLDKVNPLVRAVGQEVGVRGAWLPNWHTTVALFKLDIDSELLFVGDAGATEASRPSRRTGIEISSHYRPWTSLYVDADMAFSRSRFRDSDPAGDYIPGAIEKMASVGIAYEAPHGWNASTRLRYFGARPLIENNRVRSHASTLVNARLGYRVTPQFSVNLDVLNLFDKKVSDIDYFYTSRLAGEPVEGVDDVHTHPAEPRTLRLTATLNY